MSESSHSKHNEILCRPAADSNYRLQRFLRHCLLSISKRLPVSARQRMKPSFSPTPPSPPPAPAASTANVAADTIYSPLSKLICWGVQVSALGRFGLANKACYCSSFRLELLALILSANILSLLRMFVYSPAYQQNRSFIPNP